MYKNSGDWIRLFWEFSVRSRLGHFGQHLNLQLEEHGGPLRVLRVGETESLVSALLPEWLVTPACDHVPLDGLMAVYDEVSTFAGVVPWDKTFRPGLSVSLRARAGPALAQALPGMRVYVSTRRRKMGKTLAFVDVQMRLGEGEGEEVLLEGEHTKFMATDDGVLVSASPDDPSERMRLMASLVPLTDEPEDPRPLRSIAGAFGLRRPEAGSDGDPAAYLATLDPTHGNPVGAIHGGAAVMIVAEGARTHRLERERADPDRYPCGRLRMVDVSLMSAVPTSRPSHVSVHTVSERPAPPGVDEILKTTVSYAGGPAIDGVTVWAP